MGSDFAFINWILNLLIRLNPIVPDSSVAMNRVEPNSSSRLICLSGLEQNLSGLEPSCPIWVSHHALSVACFKLAHPNILNNG